MKNIFIFFLLLISSLSYAQFTGYKTGSGFEVLPITTGFNGQEATQSYSLRRVENRKRFGNASLRVELRESDPLFQNGTRSELYLFTPATNPDTTIRKVAFSIYFPSDSFPVDSKEWIFMQFHTGQGSPNFSLKTMGTRIYADIRSATNSEAAPWGKQDLGPIVYNQWLDFRTEYYPRNTEDGYVKVWINDNQVLNFVNRSNYPNPGGTVRYLNGVPGPFWKIGGYKWQWNTTTPQTPSYGVVYIDSIIIARMSAPDANMDVTPSVGNLPPTVEVVSPIITLNNTTEVTLQSTGSDPEAGPLTYLWTRESGPNTPTIVSPNSNNTQVTGLTIGTYTFKVTVTDNAANTASKFVTVQVNNPPTIDLTSNTSQVVSNGTADLVAVVNDPDGNNANLVINWIQVTGNPGVTIVSPNSASTQITGLQPGVEYTFRITATDEDGGVSVMETDIYIINVASKRNRKKVAGQL